MIVGKNDTGKTGFLNRFFDQHFYEGAIHSTDRPQVPGFEGEPISFSLSWVVQPEDDTYFPLARAFGRQDVRVVEVLFHQDQARGEDWSYQLDGQPLAVHTEPTANGHPIMRDELQPRNLFPMPHYISISSPLLWHFEARFYELSPGAMEALRIRELLPVETMLLRAADLRAETRRVAARGIEEPWPRQLFPRTSLTITQIEDRLRALSDRITRTLQQWWTDPPGLRFIIRLMGNDAGKEYQHRNNSYGLVCTVVDEQGLGYSGTGLLWFITFIVELLYVENHGEPLLLLFDEPATPLHPSAQRAAAKFLGSLTTRHQVIYSTHSPFMIDWNFPQRIRLFRRDYDTKRTHIDNAPYRPTIPAERVWDPLRSSIGVTLGDVAVIGEANILVEGITDQILLANASALLRERGYASVDLAKVSIIPFAEEPVLRQLVAMVRAKNARVTVLVDADRQGEKVRAYCRRERIPYVRIETFTDRGNADSGIEDIIGLEEYLLLVNAFYGGFKWFVPLDVTKVRMEIADRSLGAYLEEMFAAQFDESFSKTAVAVYGADQISELPETSLDRLQALITALVGEAL